MRLVGVQCPSCFELEVLLFELVPGVVFNHELSGHFIPSLLPVYSRVENQYGDLVDSGVHSYQCEPAAGH